MVSLKFAFKVSM